MSENRQKIFGADFFKMGLEAQTFNSILQFCYHLKVSNFLLRDDPCVDEMDEWLCGLLDSNFSLICEDDSCFEVARMLVEMERIIKRKDETRIKEFVDRLPKV